ncbi:Serine/threonine-protein kinase-transforming protein mos, partial [Toxocara canis]
GESATDRADIYSYGVLLWELFARRLPYEGIHPHTLIFLVVSRQLRPDTSQLTDTLEGASETDLSLLVLMQECWSGELTLRPSAVELLAKIRSFYSPKMEPVKSLTYKY